MRGESQTVHDDSMFRGQKTAVPSFHDTDSVVSYRNAWLSWQFSKRRAGDAGYFFG